MLKKLEKLGNYLGGNQTFAAMLQQKSLQEQKEYESLCAKFGKEAVDQALEEAKNTTETNITIVASRLLHGRLNR